MQIHLQAQQCDSSISVCPTTFDFLISQNIKQQECLIENNTLKLELTNLNFQLKETKSVLETTSSILLITNNQRESLEASIDLKDKTIKKQSRQIIIYKIGILSVGITEIGGFAYFGMKKLLFR